MSQMEFVGFNQVNPNDFLVVLNEDEIRRHLINHPIFDLTSVRKWMEGKIKTNSLQGCRIRAIYIDSVIAGWCGIQPDENGFELAIVISKKFWGYGIPVFKKMMCWAKELGHEEVLFHLLESRPEYRALKKIATKVYKTELLGHYFTTYTIPVGK